MDKDLFTFHGDKALKDNAPLAERLRPRTLDDFVGQDGILSEGRLLRRAIEADRVGNLLLHGPPGVGKTTLARIIAENTRSHFSILNAVLAGIKELRQEVAEAKRRFNQYQLRTILFIDEVHRFNTAQQDALLPWVEDGTVTLIGATTENPYFEVNKALVSRSRIFRLQRLEPIDLHALLQRAIKDSDYGYGKRSVFISEDAANHLVDVANGDARSLLNALELAVETTTPEQNGFIKIDLRIAEESIQERAVLYDKQGDAHFDTISAFIKSLRGSDPDAALFWLARMVEAGENPKFIFRRMLISAGEDIGLADPQAIVVVEACASAFERIGLPEGLYPLAQAALYLATTEKSNSVMGFFEAIRTIKNAQKQDVPSHLRDPNRDKASFGDGSGYRYPHAFVENWVAQQYLPNDLQGEVFWKPTNHGWEGKRRIQMIERRAAQFAAIAESVDENPLGLSFTSQSTIVDSWVQRQLSQKGFRLQKLVERLWIDVNWQRNHRVLIIGGSPLLWAIKALSAVPEGGVTLMAENEEQARIKAQIDVLEPILQPTLIDACDSALNQLPPNLTFEWIGGRLTTAQFSDEKIEQFLQTMTNRCSPNAGLRLLISNPLLGPLGSLLQLVEDEQLKLLENEFVSRILLKEKEFLYKQNIKEALIDQLNKLGWDITTDIWEEDLSLKIDSELESRWLGPNSKYRDFLDEEKELFHLDKFKNIIKSIRGKKLPQKIMHTKIIGKIKNI